MPTIETMTVDYQKNLGIGSHKVFNVEAAVGVGAPNKIGDVLLVQAMMKEISRVHTAEFYKVPVAEVTGKINSITIQSIWGLQRSWSMFLMGVDGRIDPASLAGRTLRLKAEKYTMIQMLDRYLGSALSIGHKIDDYIVGLQNLYPQLRAHLHDKTKGSASTTVS